MECSARLCIELDTPDKSPKVLKNLELKCSVGRAKPTLPSSAYPIKIQASTGEQGVTTVPVKNPGNIPLNLNLTFKNKQDDLQVLPSDLSIPPGEKKDFYVMCNPTSHVPQIER